MKTNNGKIAIAVVAMFVVSLSIVGFTYAYFTARITGNTKEKSVEISAGQLIVNYTSGNVIQATNIVPGWKSDGLSYYKPDNMDANHNIIAYNASSVSDETFINDAPTSASGLTSPATFTVENTGDNKNDAYFIIRLKNITNGLSKTVSSVNSEGETETFDDTVNLKLSLYEGSFDDYSTANDTLIYKTTLAKPEDLAAAKDNAQIIVPNAITVNNDDTGTNVKKRYYYIILEYLNATFDQADDMGKSISATVDIVGVSSKRDTNEVYDADGTPISFTASE